MKKLAYWLLTAAAAMLLTACSSGHGEEKIPPVSTDNVPADAVRIVLSDGGVTVDGSPAPTEAGAPVYTAHDIVYYERGHGKTYGEGKRADSHSEKDAAEHTVVHIAAAGEYAVSGTLTKGQIAVDLGKGAEDDPAAVVTLYLNGVDITCTVAPAVIFYNVYECSSADEETAVMNVDTSAAGANVCIADGSVNNVTGAYIARIYDPDTVELDESGKDVVSAKKLHKYDAAFYSKMSMNISGGTDGSGVLNINAENEGLGTELHLTVSGGNIRIRSGNDGINTNEDNVSVTTVTGGNLLVSVTGETGEGDGIDSNGWLVITGGSVTASAWRDGPDNGIDSDRGIYIKGAEVFAAGNNFTAIAEGSGTRAVFTFPRQEPTAPFAVKNADGTVIAEKTVYNACKLLVFSLPDLPEGEYSLWCGDKLLSKVNTRTG